MLVLLLAAALFYPAQTCKKDDPGIEERDPDVLHQPGLYEGQNTTEDRQNIIVGLSPSLEQALLGRATAESTHQSRKQQSKRKNSDELSAKRNEILRRAYELPPLFNYYDILPNENDLMENKRKRYSLLPNYFNYPRYFGYKF